MKFVKRTIRLIALLLLAVSVFASSGCAGKTYAGTINPEEGERFVDEAKAGNRIIEINGRQYEGSYLASYKDVFSGRMRDQYSLGLAMSAEVDSVSGTVKLFYGVKPFDPIDGAAEMGEEELVSAVKEKLSPLTDASVYNEYKVERNPSTGSILIELFKKEEIELNESVSVILDGEGNICHFRIIEGCPEGTAMPKVGDEEIDAIIREKIKERFGLDDGVYELQRKALTVYNGRPALLITVSVSDENGIKYGLLPILISEKQD